MHPKPLLDLCLDRIVYCTVLHQKRCADLRRFSWDVGQLWTKLWELPVRIPLRASELLHALIWQNYYDKEITISLLALLASQARRIVLVRTSQEFGRVLKPWVLQECGMFRSQHQLQELDLQGVFLGPDVTFLLHLLPQCPRLTILKLGLNVSNEVLYAAQTCPLEVLYISEQNSRRNTVTQEYLIEMLLGIQNRSAKDLLGDFQSRKTIEVNPTWPKLTEVCFGSCNLQSEFFVLILLLFPGIQWIPTHLFQIQKIMSEYYRVMIEMKTVHPLSLHSCNVTVNSDILKILPTAAPDLENIKVHTRYKKGTMYAEEILTIGKMFPKLKTLHLYELLHFPPDEPSLKLFTSVGSKLVALELYGGRTRDIHLKDIVTCLEVCPLLQQVTLAFNHGIVCDFRDLNELPEEKSFKNVKLLKCTSNKLKHDSISCLLRMLPGLEKLTVSGKLDNTDLLLTHLLSLPELRVVVMMVSERFSVRSLCKMCRATKDKLPWEIYAPKQCISNSDKEMLSACGWTYIPINLFNPDWF